MVLVTLQCHYSWEHINNNSTGIVNFIVNVCPTGIMTVGNKNEARYYRQNIDISALMDGIDIENFFTDM